LVDERPQPRDGYLRRTMMEVTKSEHWALCACCASRIVSKRGIGTRDDHLANIEDGSQGGADITAEIRLNAENDRYPALGVGAGHKI
jgi:hypothetical protein